MTLVTRHLVPLLKTAGSLQALDAATFAIQELLRHYRSHEGLRKVAGQQGEQGEQSGGENRLFR